MRTPSTPLTSVIASSATRFISINGSTTASDLISEAGSVNHPGSLPAKFDEFLDRMVVRRQVA